MVDTDINAPLPLTYYLLIQKSNDVKLTEFIENIIYIYKSNVYHMNTSFMSS
jgi:hypothetical protein